MVCCKRDVKINGHASLNRKRCKIVAALRAITYPTATRHLYTLNRRNVEVNVEPITVIVCVPAIENDVAVAVAAVTEIAQLAVLSEAETPVTYVMA